MGTEEEEEVQVKVICNIIKKIIAENFPNIKKELPIQVQEDSKTPNRLDHIIYAIQYWHITVKTTSTENKERMLKAV
jgi:hypothetical protein